MQTKFQQRRNAILRYFENYKRHIFWLILYTLVTFAIFAERAYCKSMNKKKRRSSHLLRRLLSGTWTWRTAQNRRIWRHGDEGRCISHDVHLQQLACDNVSKHYHKIKVRVLLLLGTIASAVQLHSHQFIFVNRETFLNRYIPFDAAVEFHKYIAILALLYTSKTI